MSDKPGNQTPDTPEVSETELREMKVDELRQEARDENISGASGMRKEELVSEVANARSEGSASRGDNNADRMRMIWVPDPKAARSGTATHHPAR
jgi:hypothetical protein